MGNLFRKLELDLRLIGMLAALAIIWVGLALSPTADF
jgi:ABC-type xylose transport system permease subunit